MWVTSLGNHSDETIWFLKKSRMWQARNSYFKSYDVENQVVPFAVVIVLHSQYQKAKRKFWKLSGGSHKWVLRASRPLVGTYIEQLLTLTWILTYFCYAAIVYMEEKSKKEYTKSFSQVWKTYFLSSFLRRWQDVTQRYPIRTMLEIYRIHIFFLP